MADEEKALFMMVEWTVGRISCWNRRIHGTKITSPTFKAGFDLMTLKMELIPGGIGRGNHVAVRFRYTANSDFSGDFFMTAGGSLLWAHELRAQEGRSVLELTSAGPKFEDLIGMEDDAVTLKCRIRCCCDELHRARSAIDAFDSSWKMSPKTFDGLESRLDDTLSTIRYPLDDEEEPGELSLRLFPGNALVLEPEACGYIFSEVAVQTRLVVTTGGSTLRTESKEHVFVGGCLQAKRPQKDGADSVLSEDLRRLRRDQDHSDFRIRCGEVTVPVHKNILSARSPVFKSMISSNMKEATSGAMDITDIDPDTLALFLTFLYTGTVEGLQFESALSLYHAADKYEVPSLKKVCADVVSGNVSVSNVCDVLLLADQHLDDQVKAAAQDFFLENFDEVLRSAEWEELLGHAPRLAGRTLTSVSLRRGSSPS